MRFFKSIYQSITQPDATDADLYAYIANEVANGILREGIWAKSLTEANFDQLKAKSIYMRMAVSSLKDEIKQLQFAEHRAKAASERANRLAVDLAAKAELDRKNDLMQRAFDLYAEQKFDLATEGLLMRVELMRDHRAAAVLSYIFAHGLHSDKTDREAAIAMVEFAEQSQDPNIRKYLGDSIRPLDEIRALANYEFSAKGGNAEAKVAAKYLRDVLEFEKKVPKRGLFSR